MKEGFLTQHIQKVAVANAAKFILHQASIVASIGRYHTLHDQTPVLMPELRIEKVMQATVITGAFFVLQSCPFFLSVSLRESHISDMATSACGKVRKYR